MRRTIEKAEPLSEPGLDKPKEDLSKNFELMRHELQKWYELYSEGDPRLTNENLKKAIIETPGRDANRNQEDNLKQWSDIIEFFCHDKVFAPLKNGLLAKLELLEKGTPD